MEAWLNADVTPLCATRATCVSISHGTWDGLIDPYDSLRTG
jgi:hypothetical protein